MQFGRNRNHSDPGFHLPGPDPRGFTSRAQIPVAGATVAFTQRSTEGRHTLLALRVTDANGRTQPVRVGTPDPSASESSGTAEPFAVCDIWVESPGYELLVVENVQIFPNTQTLQRSSPPLCCRRTR